MQGSHAKFFASLRQVEKRLKLEDRRPSPPSEESPPVGTQRTDSLGTPMYLNFSHSADTNASDIRESDIPREFLSNSPDFSATPGDSPDEHQPETRQNVDRSERFDVGGEIEQLMQLLRLSGSEDVKDKGGASDLGCDEGFYGNIVGVKGPKSAQEVERVEGWIKHLLKGEKEPLRLAHLLLVKAAFVYSGSDSDGFGDFVFPSTVDEFLHDNSPVET